MSIFEDDEHLPVLKNESGEEYAGCDKCNTDVYLMDMDTIMIDSIYYVFYNLRSELEIAMQRKKLCKSSIIAALNTVNIPLLDKKGARVEGRAGEYYIQGLNINGIDINVMIDTYGVHISI